MAYTHSCIKCKTKYQSDDSDAYLCESCNEERKRIAEEVDKKMAGRTPRNVKSDLQVYYETIEKNGGKFVNIKDLGIKL